MKKDIYSPTNFSKVFRFNSGSNYWTLDFAETPEKSEKLDLLFYIKLTYGYTKMSEKTTSQNEP